MWTVLFEMVKLDIQSYALEDYRAFDKQLVVSSCLL